MLCVMKVDEASREVGHATSQGSPSIFIPAAEAADAASLQAHAGVMSRLCLSQPLSCLFRPQIP